MKFTIIAETNGDLLHQTTYQLIGAISNIGSKSTVICPNGKGSSEASKIKGVEKIIEIKLSKEEEDKFKKSVQSVKDLYSAAKNIDSEL